MTHDEAFLADIVENLDDDTPRLVYADWLEDHGRVERAEFIRLQCELARLPEADPRRADLAVREQQLLKEHGKEWTAALPRAVKGTFERGFLAGVRMKAKSFSGLRAVLCSCPTVRHLHLVGPFMNRKPSMQTVASSPHLARLTSLELSDGYYFIGPEEVAILAASPHVAGLTALALHNNAMGDGGLAAVTGSPQLEGLTTLALSCYGFGSEDFFGVEGVRVLASSRHLPRLATLRLARCGLEDEASRLLVGATSLAGLHTLDLRNNGISHWMKEQLRDRFGARVIF